MLLGFNWEFAGNDPYTCVCVCVKSVIELYAKDQYTLLYVFYSSLEKGGVVEKGEKERKRKGERERERRNKDV